MNDPVTVPPSEPALEALVERARTGDRHALERVVGAIHHDIYGLALRMLWHPEDAEDATQEILIRVITRLETFRGESRFGTWVYRVACNHLLTTRRRRMESLEISFDAFAIDLAEGLDTGVVQPDDEQKLLEEEVKIGCTTAMLLCLDREHRLAYVLGEVFALTGEQAGGILDIEPAAFRKRLSRARARIRSFMQGHCGIVNPASPCRCARRLRPAIAQGRVDPANLRFARHPVRGPDQVALLERVESIDSLHASAALMRAWLGG